MTSLAALNALNFFMADVRDGLGPFLGVFLQDRGWAAGRIGLVMSIAGIVGVAVTTPLGVLVDHTRAKRLLMAVSALVIIAGSALTYLHAGFAVTAVAQAAAAIGAAVIVPLIAALTLGIVRQQGYARQLGRNEAFNHAGNATAAVLAGLLGWRFGFVAVFALMAAMAVASIAVTLMIRESDIDHRAARGADSAQDAAAAPVPLRSLARSRPLRLVVAVVLLFHLGNAAMLPLLGQAMVARGDAWDPSAYTAATVLIAQGTMIGMALLASRSATATWGCSWPHWRRCRSAA